MSSVDRKLIRLRTRRERLVRIVNSFLCLKMSWQEWLLLRLLGVVGRKLSVYNRLLRGHLVERVCLIQSFATRAHHVLPRVVQIWRIGLLCARSK